MEQKDFKINQEGKFVEVITTPAVEAKVEEKEVDISKITYMKEQLIGQRNNLDQRIAALEAIENKYAELVPIDVKPVEEVVAEINPIITP